VSLWVILAAVTFDHDGLGSTLKYKDYESTLWCIQGMGQHNDKLR
jgi:hypothetical protein